MTIACYLAGSSQEHELVAAFASKLEATGLYSITYPWWNDVAKAKAERRDANRGMSRDEARRLMKLDVRAVCACYVFWLLMPETLSIGCFVELGVAMREASMRSGQMSLIVSGDYGRSIFTSSWEKDVTFATHDDALARLLEVVP